MCGLPKTAIVCLDQLRADVSDDDCDQDATAYALALMDLWLEPRYGSPRRTGGTSPLLFGDP